MYIFLGRIEVETSDSFITGTMFIFQQPTFILFHLGSIYSYVFAYYATRSDVLSELLVVTMHLSTFTGDF